MAAAFKTFQPTNTFLRDLKGLDAGQQAAVQQCIEDLMRDPVPGSRRVHRLNPKSARIQSADVYTNSTTHKLTFTVVDGHATLRRVGTHRQIDRAP